MKKYKLVKQISILENENAALASANRDLTEKLFELRRDMAHLERISFVDSLTGTGNQRALTVALTRAIGDYRRTGTEFVVVAVDVNDLKPTNDKLGHEAGDKLIKSVADILAKAARKTDSVFRQGGDEFVVILSNTPNGFPFKKRIEELCKREGISLASGWSASSILLRRQELSEEESGKFLLKKADHEMYLEKRRHKISRAQRRDESV